MFVDVYYTMRLQGRGRQTHDSCMQDNCQGICSVWNLLFYIILDILVATNFFYLTQISNWSHSGEF